jgi:hypothetical protein
LDSIAHFGCDPLKGTIVVPLLLFDFICVFGLGFWWPYFLSRRLRLGLH